MPQHQKTSIKFLFVFLLASIFFPKTTYAVTELLVNGGAESGQLDGWTFTNGAGSSWAISSNLDLVHSGARAFIGSYGLGSMVQTIDLSEQGFSDSLMDAEQPEITISDYVRGVAGASTSDMYRINVQLLNASNAVITEFDTGTSTASGTWLNITHSFTAYGTGVRSIRYIRYGDDAEFWAGFYGTMYDSGSLTIDAVPVTEYTVSYSAGTGGEISGSQTQTIESGEDSSSVLAVPQPGFYFVRWSDGSTTNPRNHTNVTEDISVSALFERNPARIQPPPQTESGEHPQMIIANGASTTETPTVPITFIVNPATVSHMAISLDPAMQNVAQIPFSKSTTISLPTHDEYTIYAYLYSASGIASQRLEQKIVFSEPKKEVVVIIPTPEKTEHPLTESITLPQETNEPENPVQLSNTNSNELAEIKKTGFQFKRNLRFGMYGEDVRELQKFLNINGFQTMPTGSETIYFGKLTRDALTRFQEHYSQEILQPQDIVKGTGLMLNFTRKKINEMNAS